MRVLELKKEIYDEQIDKIHRRTGRLFTLLLLLQWLAAIGCALIVSPRTWTGDQYQIHLHVYAAIFLGGAIVSLPIFLSYRRPGWWLTRHCVAFAEMCM